MCKAILILPDGELVVVKVTVIVFQSILVEAAVTTASITPPAVVPSELVTFNSISSVLFIEALPSKFLTSTATVYLVLPLKRLSSISL